MYSTTEMSNQLVIFDIDDTLINGQSQRHFLAFLYRNRYITLLHYVRVLWWFLMYKLSIVKNPEKVMSFAYSFLSGKELGEVQEITDSFYCHDLKFRIYPLAINEIENHKKQGRDILFLSNAGQPLVQKIATELAADAYICTQLELKDGVYTGKVEGRPVYGENKVIELKQFLINKKYDVIQGYADHFSDITFLEFVDIPNVVNPDRRLQKIAKSKGWKILNFDLNNESI